uniref:Uncharacterized protein n=1 Tax=Labrus bergylta TaxID=56723 RepID=A0A3Q3LFU4_9LABR
MTVKHLSVEYNKVNERGTFSPGDTLSGKVTVVMSKETKVQCFVVKTKGKAKVIWSEQKGQNKETHSDKKIYFYFEHIILQDKNKGDGSEIISPGRNVFPFAFEIPNMYIPSSYEGKWGKITYSLRAQLTLSIWSVHKSKTQFPFLTKSEFPFASKSEMIIIGLKVTDFTSYFNHDWCEALGVSVEVFNQSARTVTPKFYLCEEQTFAARSQKIVHTNETLFGTGDSVPAHTNRTMTKVISIPPQLYPTFFNCSMMRLEYRLKVFVAFSYFLRVSCVLPAPCLLPPGSLQSAAAPDAPGSDAA